MNEKMKEGIMNRLHAIMETIMETPFGAVVLHLAIGAGLIAGTILGGALGALIHH